MYNISVVIGILAAFYIGRNVGLKQAIKVYSQILDATKNQYQLTETIYKETISNIQSCMSRVFDLQAMREKQTGDLILQKDKIIALQNEEIKKLNDTLDKMEAFEESAVSKAHALDLDDDDEDDDEDEDKEDTETSKRVQPTVKVLRVKPQRAPVDITMQRSDMANKVIKMHSVIQNTREVLFENADNMPKPVFDKLYEEINNADSD